MSLAVPGTRWQEDQNGDVESFSDDSAYGGPLADTYDEEDSDLVVAWLKNMVYHDMAGGGRSAVVVESQHTDDEFLDVDTSQPRSSCNACNKYES